MKSRFRFSSLITAASLLGACLQQTPTPPSIPNSLNAADATAQPAALWESVMPGLERRTIRPNNSILVSFTALRIDPAYFTFRAHYRAGDPLSVSGWHDALPDAVALINANFFNQDNRILGMLVSDGVVSGESYRDRGGMFYVENGQVNIRSLIDDPYQGETLEQAVQAFPMLVNNSDAAFDNTRGDRAARRTAIGIDSDGRVIWLISSSLLGMRLTDLSAFLPTADLDLVTAFNLDGGGSTLLYLADHQIPSFDPVPAVLAIYAR